MGHWLLLDVARSRMCVWYCSALLCSEEELLEELEEQIESCQAKIDYNDQQIVAIAGPNGDGSAGDVGIGQVDADEEDADGALTGSCARPCWLLVVLLTDDDDDDDGDDIATLYVVMVTEFVIVVVLCCVVSSDVPDIRNVESLPEAKTMMKLLFNMMVNIRKEERAKVTALKELEYRVSELQDVVMEKEAALEAQQLDFDRKRLALEQKHSEATDWLFRVTCTFSTRAV